MADTPNNNGTRPDSPNQSFVHNQEAPSGTSSDTNVDVENVDEERGKDFIQKRLTLTFQNVIVRVTAPDEALGETLWSWVDPRQLGGLFKRTHRPKRVSSSQSTTLTWCHLLTCQTILHDVSGQVNPGEMVNMSPSKFANLAHTIQSASGAWSTRLRLHIPTSCAF